MAYYGSPEGLRHSVVGTEWDSSNINLSVVELLESENDAEELKTLRHKVGRMESYQKFLLDDIAYFVEENDTMAKTVEELQREKRARRRRTSNNLRDLVFSYPSIFEDDQGLSAEAKTELELEGELKKTKGKVLRLEDKIYELEKKRDEAMEQNSVRGDSLKEMKKAMKILRDEFQGSIEENRSLKSSIAEKDSIIQSLEKHCKEMGEMLSEFQTSSGNRIVNDSFDTSSVLLTIMEETMGHGLIGPFPAGNSLIAELQAQLSQNESKVLSLQEEVNSLESKLASALSNVPGTSAVEINEMMKKAKDEALQELKQEYGARVVKYRDEVEKILKDEAVKFAKLKEDYDKVLASKSKLEMQNDELMVRMDRLRRSHLHSEKVIQPSLTRKKEKLPNDWSHAKREADGRIARTLSTSSLTKNTKPSKPREKFSSASMWSLNSSTRCNNEKSDPDPSRFSELTRRNAMLPHHLRSVYPNEFMTNTSKEVDENTVKQLPRSLRSRNDPSFGRLNVSSGLISQSQSLSSLAGSKESAEQF